MNKLFSAIQSLLGSNDATDNQSYTMPQDMRQQALQNITPSSMGGSAQTYSPQDILDKVDAAYKARTRPWYENAARTQSSPITQQMAANGAQLGMSGMNNDQPQQLHGLLAMLTQMAGNTQTQPQNFNSSAVNNLLEAARGNFR